MMRPRTYALIVSFFCGGAASCAQAAAPGTEEPTREPTEQAQQTPDLSPRAQNWVDLMQEAAPVGEAPQDGAGDTHIEHFGALYEAAFTQALAATLQPSDTGYQDSAGWQVAPSEVALVHVELTYRLRAEASSSAYEVVREPDRLLLQEVVQAPRRVSAVAAQRAWTEQCDALAAQHPSGRDDMITVGVLAGEMQVNWFNKQRACHVVAQMRPECLEGGGHPRPLCRYARADLHRDTSALMHCDLLDGRWDCAMHNQAAQSAQAIDVDIAQAAAAMLNAR